MGRGPLRVYLREECLNFSAQTYSIDPYDCISDYRILEYRELLRSALESLARHRPSFEYEVIVVDNGSHDESAEMIRQDFSSVKLIANSDNRGFGAACNQAAQVAIGKYLFFLNPDAEATEGAIDTLSRGLDEDPRPESSRR